MRLLLTLLFLTACGKETVFIDTPEECFTETDESFYLVHKSPQRFQGLRIKHTCLLSPDDWSLDDGRIILTFRIKDLKMGEFIDMDIFQQVTNDTPKPIGLAWYCVQSDKADSMEGIEGFRQVGENTDDYIVHHKVTHAKCSWDITDTSKEYFHYIIYSYSGEKNQEGDWLGINDGYNNVVIRRD